MGDSEEGYVAGLLTLDARGRPIEFHCTAPLRPNRAQVILYGPTLRSYIVAEQLARVLTRHVKGTISVLWTDDGDALSIREDVDFPVGLVHPEYDASSKLGDVTSCPVPDRFQVHSAFPDDRVRIEQAWREAASWIELSEPFERIREAIREAHRSKIQSSA